MKGKRQMDGMSICQSQALIATAEGSTLMVVPLGDQSGG